MKPLRPEHFFTTLLLTAIAVLVASCDRKPPQPERFSAYRDSVIVLKPTAAPTPVNLNDSLLVRNALYEHFRHNGYLIESELDIGKFDTKYFDKTPPNAIDFLKIRAESIDATGSKIIRYYNCLPFENGHCVVPHYAIVSGANHGFEISNEEFLPPSFAIDSIKSTACKFYVFGYFYDCANQIKLKSYRIELK